MTIEQIELRKMLAQMLADNGINRETIVGFVKQIVEEKVEKAIYRTVHEVDIDGMVRGTVRETTKRALQEEVSKKVRATLSSVSISLECHEAPKQDEISALRKQVESLTVERDMLLRQFEANTGVK